jgi:hypothetical protein
MSAISASSASTARGWRTTRSRWAATAPRRRPSANAPGRGFSYDEIVPAIERLVRAYLDLREEPGETFLQAYRRLGLGPFKAALYQDEGRARCRLSLPIFPWPTRWPS